MAKPNLNYHRLDHFDGWNLPNALAPKEKTIFYGQAPTIEASYIEKNKQSTRFKRTINLVL